MKHPTIRDDLYEISGDFEICEKCGTPMENVNTRTIVPKKYENSVFYAPRWFCSNCKVYKIRPFETVSKPRCVL